MSRVDSLQVHTYTPRPPLSDFVTCFWWSERSASTSAKERVLPTGTVEFVINLQEEQLRIMNRQFPEHSQSFHNGLVCGPHSEYFTIDSPPNEVVMGVHFKPGGAMPFLPLPVDALHNMHVSFDALWGAHFSQLRQHLLTATTRTAQAHVLETFLVAHAVRAFVHHPAVTFALRVFHTVPHTHTIAAIANQMRLSHRQFIQVFRTAVGLTPKQFCRIRRFQQLIHLLQRERPVLWADVALQCGYYDQAHCIHEFQAFAGLTPSAYVQARGAQANHVPLPA